MRWQYWAMFRWFFGIRHARVWFYVDVGTRSNFNSDVDDVVKQLEKYGGEILYKRYDETSGYFGNRIVDIYYKDY